VTGDGPFDIILVGAGPAGCVLARRLTEDPARTVALIEAGPDYGPDPAMWPEPMRDPTMGAGDLHSWGYVDTGKGVVQPLALPRARVVGGSTTINACCWLRGSAADYDSWAVYNPGWAFSDLLPYFKRAETDPIGGPWHGSDGPVPVSRAAAADLSPVDRAFTAAAATLGFPWVADFNSDSRQTPGVGPLPKNIAGGMRMNAAFTYLAPARPRPNLTLLADMLVDRVIFDEARAVGVRMAAGRKVRGREVILCAGAYGSPAILLRSGIGPAADLRRLGIPLLRDLPGVGDCLLNHPIAPCTVARALAPGHDPGAAPFAPLALVARSSQEREEIDLVIYQDQAFDVDHGAPVCSLHVSLQHARSRGRVRLMSPDPAATLAIDHAHLTDPGDLEALCDGVALTQRLVATAPLAQALAPLPGAVMASDGDRDALRAWVRAHVGTTHHPSSTCRMGPRDDPRAVVDQEGRVYGVAALRVVDAAILPSGPRANLHAPVVAVAEKLADAIRRDAPAFPVTSCVS
jgi:choline dehydrogenase